MKPDLIIIDDVAAELSLEEAERLVALFRESHPALMKAYEQIGRTAVRSTSILEEFYKDVGPAISPVISKKPPRDDKRLRHSAKTGATWPKPKGSY